MPPRACRSAVLEMPAASLEPSPPFWPTPWLRFVLAAALVRPTWLPESRRSPARRRGLIARCWKRPGPGRWAA